MKAKISRWGRPLFPGDTIAPLCCTLTFQMLVYLGTKLLMQGVPHYNLESGLDLRIPFLPWTVCIYTGAFLYWFIAVVVILRGERENALRFLCAHMVSLVTALVFFLLLPTTNTRPVLTGGGFFEWCMGLIYALDTPDNLFPSLHCELSWLCWRSLTRVKGVSKFWKGLALVFTLLVFASTLTTKQHILIDVLGGWLIGELAFRLCGNKTVTRPFYKVFDR